MSIGGWRWVYYFNAIFFGFSALSILVFYRPLPTKLRRELTTASEIRSLDFLGIPLLLLGVIGVVIALTWGGNAYPWDSARVIAFLVVGIAFLVAFGSYGEPPCFTLSHLAEEISHRGIWTHRWPHRSSLPAITQLPVSAVCGLCRRHATLWSQRIPPS
jgi:hypothetical protein